jgi:protein XagA
VDKFAPIWFMLLFLPGTALAGAWTLPADDWQLITTGNYYTSDTYVNPQGDSQSQPRYSKWELSPYFEYGLEEDLTLGASAALVTVKGFNPNTGTRDENTGLADLAFFARQRLWQDDHSVLSLQPWFKFPSQYSEDRLPRSGSEEYEAELRLLGGTSFEYYGQQHFANLETAYRRRFGDPDDQLLIDATLGMRLDERWTVMPQIFTTTGLSGAGGGFTQSGADDYHLVKGQLSAVYDLDDTFSLQGGYYRDLRARNTGEGDGFLFSLWIRP